MFRHFPAKLFIIGLLNAYSGSQNKRFSLVYIYLPSGYMPSMVWLFHDSAQKVGDEQGKQY